MEDTDTDTLRKLAPCWTLAGDERLLTILQNTHQRLLTKCQAANAQLEQMATALDDANISLQNVNNQFMALSSSQFVERRVYDDDVDVAAEPPATKESPKLTQPDELSILKRSIAVIEKTHEVITILQDSDTESDTDDDLPDRLVMKPKDMYAERRLPYIIGSEPWKNKWHAGLMPEDSDTDSSTSKVDRESDQYSQSEPEDFDLVNRSAVQDIPAPQHVRQLSETSSELPSETTPNTKPTPSDIASEIARRLGGGEPAPRVVEEEPEYDEPPKPVVRKVYQPQAPVASTIFPDEPPPLDYQTDSDTDIFADLHRNQPYNQPHPRQDVAEDLFGANQTDNEEGGDIFNDFANQPTTGKPVSLFEAGPTAHMFDKQRHAEESGGKPSHYRTEREDRTSTTGPEEVTVVKKPVGGVSLFGSNKGTENIGAAILRRRKSNTSGEESGNETPSQISPIKEQQSKKEKDIFDDLFAKSETKKVKPKANNIVKDIKQEIQKQKEEKLKKDTPKPIDLFSDNLFDDIDDIFTTNVVKETKDKQKSIFEDDDDIFSEVADSKPVQQNPKTTSDNKKGLFDSDDDLFAENIAKDKPSVSNKPQAVTRISTNITKDNEYPSTTNELSTNIKTPPEDTVVPNVVKEKASIFEDDEVEEDIFGYIKSKKENSKGLNSTGAGIVAKNIEAPKNVFKSPSLFDDDDDESDLFTEKYTTTNKVFIDTSSIKPVKDENVPEKDLNLNKKMLISTSNIVKPKMEEDISEKNISTNRNKVLGETSSITKPVIGESITANSVDATNLMQNAPIKTDVDNELTNNNFEEDNLENLNTAERKSHGYVHNIDDSFEDNHEETPSTNNLNVDTKTIQEQKLLNDTTSKNLVAQEFNEDHLQETTTEISKDSITDTITIDYDKHKPNINIQETLRNTNVFDDGSLHKYISVASDNDSSFEESNINNTVIPEDENKIPHSDIFTDIVIEPPDFEKPKEPKKSKNVNALFDDDSDDEALFFKRDDVIIDEKPEDFTVKQDRLFDIFTSEPPDADFTNIDDDLEDHLFSTMPKPNLPSEITTELNINTHGDSYKHFPYDIPNVVDEIKTPTTSSNLNEKTNDIITNDRQIIKSESLKETDNKNVSEKLLPDDDDDLFKSLPVQLPGHNTESISRTDDQSDELFMSLPSNLDREITDDVRKSSVSFKLPTEHYEPQDTNSRSEVKKLGKLKIGLNINVNALLPGASPKKVKPIDNIDGQAQSQVEIQQDETKTIEPVSFDEEPESKILDNKLSKQRPRIQVKRRPSTRKARKEAVRKSGIDFGDDSTDNSSSIDDPPKKQIQTDFKTTDNTFCNETELPNKEDVIINKEKTTEEKEKLEFVNAEPEDLNLKNEKSIVSVKTELKSDLLDNQIKIESDIRRPVKSDSTTKIVYILNDEDIFNTSAMEDPVTKMDVSKNLNKENGSLSTNHVSSNLIDSDHMTLNTNSEPVIKTLGKTYQSTKYDDNKKSNSLFGEDEDDEDIFRNKKPLAKTTIFDSDSEGELFGITKKIESSKNVEKNIKEVKGPLFGDEDDDDDLFGVKTSKRNESQQSSKSSAVIKETPITATESVFEDPLSMFGDED